MWSRRGLYSCWTWKFCADMNNSTLFVELAVPVNGILVPISIIIVLSVELVI